MFGRRNLDWELPESFPEEGDPVTLHSADGSKTYDLSKGIIRMEGAKHVLLSTQYGNVAARPDQKRKIVDNAQGVGNLAQWAMEVDSNEHVSFKNKKTGQYLRVDQNGTPDVEDKPVFFKVSKTVEVTPDVDKTVLSSDDIKHFKEQGYIVIKDAFSQELVEHCLRYINNELGRPWRFDGVTKFNKPDCDVRNCLPKSLCKDVVGSPRIWSAINILFGEGNVTLGSILKDVQVAPRFPELPDESLDGPVEDFREGWQWHIDGHKHGDKKPTFTVLMAVCLSDQPKPHMGNLHVFPGSHLNKEVHENYKHCDDIKDSSDAGYEKLRNKPDLGKSTQVCVNKGDVVLVHQLVCHSAGTNYSGNIRYQCYFRLFHKDHAELKKQVYDNPFVEFAV